MIQEGVAYPLLYTSTPAPHREWLRAQAVEARAHKLGVWAKDSSQQFVLKDRSSICKGAGTLIFPKFFRRSINYLRHLESGEFKGDFATWLAGSATENDQLMLKEQAITLSKLFQHRDGTVTCQADLLDMVFVEK
jgi:hypothetical protein